MQKQNVFSLPVIIAYLSFLSKWPRGCVIILTLNLHNFLTICTTKNLENNLEFPG